MPDLERALAIAVEAHRGQQDRIGAPYILHPLRVMLRVRTTEQKIVAILHDVVEDTPWTLESLRNEGFSNAIIRAIDCLTRREGEDYFDFVLRSKSDPIARVVKLADLEDNMDVNRMTQVTDKDVERLNRYKRAKAMIEAES